MNNELQRWQERNFGQMTDDEYDRAIADRLMRRRLKALANAACAVALIAILIATAALLCAASGYHWE